MTFLITTSVNATILLAFYAVFLVFGHLKDYVDDNLKIKNGLFASLNETMLYYSIPTLLYAIFLAIGFCFIIFDLYPKP